MTAKLRVRVTPRGARDAIDGFGDDGVLRVRVAAAPADGKANDAVVRLIAKAAGVPPSRVQVSAGASARIKTIAVEGVSEAELRARLGG